MKRADSRIVIGASLIILGGLMLLERLGFFHGITEIFWGLLFLAAGVYFLIRFVKDPHEEWWAAIPGFACTGIAADNLLPSLVGAGDGFFFLAFLGMGFFTIYFSERQRWWAIIPGGVLFTLGVTSALAHRFSGKETGGIFFLGLGLTFLLVAVLGSLQWAYIPGVILLLLGVLVSMAIPGVFAYIWPAALVLVGLLLVFRFPRNQ